MQVSVDKHKLCLFACKCDESAALAFLRNLSPVAEQLPPSDPIQDEWSCELGSCNAASYASYATIAAEMIQSGEDHEGEDADFLQLVSSVYATLSSRFPPAEVQPDLVVTEGEDGELATAPKPLTAATVEAKEPVAEPPSESADDTPTNDSENKDTE